MQNLILRQPLASDLEAVVRIHCDPRTNQFNPAGTMSPEHAPDLLESWIPLWRENRFGYWAAAPESSPELVIGFGGVMQKSVAYLHGLNMYLRFAPEAWGNGYAAELAEAALAFAFSELRAPAVLGLVRPANLPSRRTLERAGFVRFSTADDVDGEEPRLLYRASPYAR